MVTQRIFVVVQKCVYIEGWFFKTEKYKGKKFSIGGDDVLWVNCSMLFTCLHLCAPADKPKRANVGFKDVVRNFSKIVLTMLSW